MWLAAYMVTGFLVASVYAVGMLRGRRDRYHRLGFLIPFTVAAIATPIQLFVGDIAARDVSDDQPAKFAAMECVYETGAEPDGVHRRDLHRRRGQVRHRDPGLDSLLAGFSTDTDVTGLDQIPRRRAPPALDPDPPRLRRDGRDRHALLALAPGSPSSGGGAARLPERKWFLRAAPLAGVASVIAL